MTRIILILFLSHSTCAYSQDFDRYMDFVPLPKNEGWAWYDIINDSISDTYFFSDFVPPDKAYANGFILKNDSVWGVMNGAGFEELPFEYDSIIFLNEHFLTLKNGQWNYLQLRYDSENEIHPIQFDSLYSDGDLLYVYVKGKTGIITRNGTFLQPTFAFLHPFTCVMRASEDSDLNYYMALEDKEFNLLDATGRVLLPENVWDLRCTEDGIFEFRRGEFPEYYSPYSNEIISPNGCDIVFYGGLGYKIYNESKTKGVLFIYGKEKLNFYDDYFPLRSYDLEYMAVRQNGKVGLVRNGVLQGRIRYDQINNMQFVGSDDAIKFLFFIGDSCGVMTANGQELMQPKYANILETSDEDRFIVLDRELAGVVDRTGKTIIPLQYDYISYEQASQLFVVQHKKKIGLFRRDGSQLVPIAYAKYSSSFSSVRDDYSSVGSGIHILGNGDKIYFANSTGLIDGIAYNHYDYTAGVLKAYKTDGITVFALNPNGSVEEVTTYPLYRPATIEKDYRPFNEAYLGWHVSLLEENQQKGYFGLRYYSKRGFGVEPSYRTVRVTVFANCLGEVAYQDQSIPWLGDIPMTLIRSYDELKPGSGSIENERLFNSETIIYDYGSDDRRINFTLDR